MRISRVCTVYFSATGTTRRTAKAAADAAAFVQQCVSRTLALATPPLEGVEFEGLLGLLTSGGSLPAVAREEL